MVEHRRLPVDGDGMLSRRAEPILENRALAAGWPSDPLGRDTRGAVEGANEVRKVVEADIESDSGDGARIFRQQPHCAAQPGPEQILVRCHAEHAVEYAQEIKHAESGFSRNGVEPDGFMRMSVYPQRGFHGAGTVACARTPALPRTSRPY